MSVEEVDDKISRIEATMTQVLRDAESLPSTYVAATALAKRRIREGSNSAKEQVHAG
jgi:hypothetical protein